MNSNASGAEWISSLEAGLAQPGFVARRIFDNRLYSSGHGYGNLYTLESLEAITRDDIVAFYESRRHARQCPTDHRRRHHDRRRACLCRAALRRLGRLGRGDQLSQPCRKISGQQILLVDRPGSTQATFRIGNIGIQGDSLDYFPARVMNHVLGGTFTSRLVQNIREEKGYTYSIGSGFTYPADIGLLPNLGGCAQ